MEWKEKHLERLTRGREIRASLDILVLNAADEVGGVLFCPVRYPGVQNGITEMTNFIRSVFTL